METWDREVIGCALGDDGVAHVELRRPDRANSIDLDLARQLDSVTQQLRGDDRVRAVLLTGAGSVFCGGGDVKSFGAADDLASLLADITASLHAGLSYLTELEAPVVGAVQGSAAGAGLGLVGACDLVVAAASARFVMAYTGIGVTPDGSSSYFLPRIVGPRRFLELTLTNRVLSADEAHEWGLVNRVVADDALGDEAWSLARTLAAGPTRAFGATKRLLRSSEHLSLEEQMASERDELTEAARRPDATEGIAAFVEKRPPRFTGE